MDLDPKYELGDVELKSLWVDPDSGDDRNDGSSSSKALCTLGAAWRLVPDTPSQGWRILLGQGIYEAESNGQIQLYNKRGTRASPIVIQPAESRSTIRLPQLDFERCSHIALLDLELRSSRATDVEASHDNILHFGDCDHVLVRGVRALGEDTDAGLPRLTFKANQTSHLYVEDSEFSGAYAYAFAYVAVHYGHIVRSRFGKCGMNAVCLKGGSAYHLVAGNEASHCKGLGINIGEGTGFAYMVEPWLQYEAYDIKVVNNVIHDAGGGLGVGGACNTLLAYNTCYRVGTQRDAIVIAFGGRGWVGDAHEAASERYHRAGGWCSRRPGECHIPNRNITVVNNLVLNPGGFESCYAHFGISGPVHPEPDSNIPDPVETRNLHIAGNLIWNGGPDKPVLDDVEDCYGLAARPTVNGEDLRKANTINTLKPELEDPENGDFRPRKGMDLTGVSASPIPPFDYDHPAYTRVPAGEPDNTVSVDRDGRYRNGPCVGAYAQHRL